MNLVKKSISSFVVPCSLVVFACYASQDTIPTEAQDSIVEQAEAYVTNAMPTLEQTVYFRNALTTIQQCYSPNSRPLGTIELSHFLAAQEKELRSTVRPQQTAAVRRNLAARFAQEATGTMQEHEE